MNPNKWYTHRKEKNVLPSYSYSYDNWKRIDSIGEEEQRVDDQEIRTCGHLGSMPEWFSQGKETNWTDLQDISESDKENQEEGREVKVEKEW